MKSGYRKLHKKALCIKRVYKVANTIHREKEISSVPSGAHNTIPPAS